VQNISVITDATITDITENTAKCTFTIHPVGATQKVGVIYGVDPSLLSGTADVSTTNVSGGTVTLNLVTLREETTYYYKAYAMDKMNSYVYSTVSEFKTKPTPVADVSVSKISATYLAGSYALSITANSTWSVTSNQSWCTVLPAFGEGDREITVSVTENTTDAPRTATLGIKTGSQTKQVTVEQDILSFSVSATTINAANTVGNYTFNITANSAWNVASNQTWCTVQPASGEGDREITVSVTENTTDAPRTAILTITAGSQTKQVTVEQDLLSFSVSATTINAANTAGNYTFNITANSAWSVASNQSWCTVQPASGTGNKEITVFVTDNTTDAPRMAILTITAGSQSKQVTVEQDLLSFQISETKIDASPFSDNYMFNITANAAWTIASDQYWCTVQPVSGDGNKFITVYVTENTTTTPRTAVLTIVSGSQSKQVVVEQDARGIEFGNGITAAASFGGGNGTQSSPYQINNARQLKKLVDEGNTSGNYFKLNTDIEVSAYEWIPVIYSGTFDGGGHTISGTMRSSQYHSFGFFRNIWEGEISNLTIAATVECYLSDTYDLTIGALVGHGQNCTIRNCHLTGVVTGGTSVGGCVTGGLAGTFLGTIQDCTISGSVTGGSAGDSYRYHTGGVVGNLIHLSTITNCMMSGKLAKGQEIGGIVGYNSGLVTNCTVSAEATFNLNNDREVFGGIVGANAGTREAYGVISNCTNHATLIGLACGGLAAWNTGEIHTSLNTGNVSGSRVVGGLVGDNWDNDIAIGHVYSCNTNHGSVNGQAANASNQIGNGNPVEPCPDGHAKR
jgi:hypothetical protein